MKKKTNTLNLFEIRTGKKKEDDPQGYPLYPDSEDIYENFQEETDINPEDISKTKALNSNNDLRGINSDNESIGNDLDVPGSELDDAREAMGNEDEENNYYSLGGDDHNDLEEDQGI